MGECDFTRFKQPPPYHHQKQGVQFLLAKPYAALFDEQGVAKTRQVIDAACVLHAAGKLSTLVIVCPAMCKSVWLDEDFGEIDKWCWTPALVHDYCAERGGPQFPPAEKGVLTIVVTSYEFLRSEVWRKKLDVFMAARRTWLVLDESIFIKNPKAVQTKAVMKLAASADRRTVLNGTPQAQGQWDLYQQMEFLNPNILGFKNYYHFRARHCRLGGFQNRQIVEFLHEAEFQKKIQPYILRRTKDDVLDLDPKLYTHRTIPLTERTWALYKQMRDEMILWLQDNTSVAAHGAIKNMRLSQLTSGLVGGLVDPFGEILTAEQVGLEKIECVVEHVRQRLAAGCDRILIWCRFRPELFRLSSELHSLLGVAVHRLVGSQSDKEQEIAKRIFQGDTPDPVILCGQPQAGGFGLTFTRCHEVIYLSNDYSLLTRSQSEDRCHRAGQVNKVTYLDVIATGPKGQQTVDHAIVKALRKKQDVATWTMKDWAHALSD
jgi:SWI/SNF-related matrix-associated actin-dependent regulator 1 of chromatin subfamily A